MTVAFAPLRPRGAARLGGSVTMQSLGKVPFKGKAAAVEIFAVMARQLRQQA